MATPKAKAPTYVPAAVFNDHTSGFGPAPRRRTRSAEPLGRVREEPRHPPKFNYRGWATKRIPPIYFMGSLPQDNINNIKVLCTRISKDMLGNETEGPYFCMIMFQQEILAATADAPVIGFTVASVPCLTPFDAFAVSLAFDQHFLITTEEQRGIVTNGFRIQEPTLLRQESGRPWNTHSRVDTLDPNAPGTRPRMPTTEELLEHLLIRDRELQQQGRQGRQEPTPKGPQKPTKRK